MDQRAARSPAGSADLDDSTRSAGLRRPSGSASRGRNWSACIPPQHGAWAFLIVPVLAGFAVSGSSPAGWVLGLAWVCAYPVGYFGGRALTARVRRGGWSRFARRELGRAVPWALATAALGVPLALSRPWLWAAAALLAVLWLVGLRVAAERGERSLVNDLLLVGQAVVAVPLTVGVVAGLPALTGPLAGATATCTAVVATYLAGSVLHVKSLLRGAAIRGYREANLAWHGTALVGTGLLSAWWLVAFLPAFVRAIGLRPGLRPAVIGVIEAVVAVLFTVAAFGAL